MPIFAEARKKGFSGNVPRIPIIHCRVQPVEEIQKKMQDAGQNRSAITSFTANYRKFADGEQGRIPEEDIEPVTKLPKACELPQPGDTGNLLDQLVVIKLNGGLGTSMGLDKAKSLLEVKEGLNFLDFIARQVLFLRSSAPGLKFLLMNSFSTSADTCKFLLNYPDLGAPSELEFVQSRVPKIDAKTMRPVRWDENPTLEWCPPGHGDIYTAMEGSGRLDALLAAGVRYAFFSNADNLGATPSPRILNYFASQQSPFLMEVTRRTEADNKGGHLTRHREEGRLILRELAQCPEEDSEYFKDISRHAFFNTNNLWIRLDRLKELMSEEGGFIPLPLITNRKTVDPRDPASPEVFQLETAMGAAIGLFHDSIALEVDRSRFAPVKKTSDLMVLRSDAYTIRDDWTIAPADSMRGRPPVVSLSSHYRTIDQFDKLVPQVPSLAGCTRLVVDGPVTFNGDISISGKVEITTKSGQQTILPEGAYCDRIVTLQPE